MHREKCRPLLSELLGYAVPATASGRVVVVTDGGGGADRERNRRRRRHWCRRRAVGHLHREREAPGRARGAADDPAGRETQSSGEGSGGNPGVGGRAPRGGQGRSIGRTLPRNGQGGRRDRQRRRCGRAVMAGGTAATPTMGSFKERPMGEPSRRSIAERVDGAVGGGDHIALAVRRGRDPHDVPSGVRLPAPIRNSRRHRR